MAGCESPFSYSSSTSTTIETSEQISLTGSYTLPEYSTPSTQLCLLGWNPAEVCNCHSCGWRGWGTCCSWCSGNSYWYDCSTIPGIEIWPAITFGAKCNLNMIFEAGEEIVISETEPAEPVETTSIVLNSCPLTLTANGTVIDIELIPNPITMEQENGTFSLSVELAGYSSSVETGGITYKLDISSSILFCLEPVPPSGWINIDLDCTLSANGDGISYEASFTISAPIVSVED